MGFCLSIIKTGKGRTHIDYRFIDLMITRSLMIYFNLIFFMAIFAVCCPFNLITYISEIP